jgi:hypothetical protein
MIIKQQNYNKSHENQEILHNNWDALAYNSSSKTLVNFRVTKNPRVLEQEGHEKMKAWLLLTNNLSCIESNVRHVASTR